MSGPTTIYLDGSVTQTLYLPRIAGAGTLKAEPDADVHFPLPMDFGIGIAYDVTDDIGKGCQVTG